MAKFHTITENIKFSEYDGRKISLSTKEGKPLQIQFPRMYMPFGISGFTPEVGATKYNIDFSMKGYDEEDNYVKKFYNTLHDVEEMVVQHVADNSEAIFGHVMGINELKPMFNSNIKEMADREPKFRVRVDTHYDGSGFKSQIYDKDKISLTNPPSNGLYARNSGVGIVEMNSVYFLNKKFGVTWKLNQLIVHEPQQLKGFQFVI